MKRQPTFLDSDYVRNLLARGQFRLDLSFIPDGFQMFEVKNGGWFLAKEGTIFAYARQEAIYSPAFIRYVTQPAMTGIDVMEYIQDINAFRRAITEFHQRLSKEAGKRGAYNPLLVDQNHERLIRRFRRIRSDEQTALDESEQHLFEYFFGFAMDRLGGAIKNKDGVWIIKKQVIHPDYIEASLRGSMVPEIKNNRERERLAYAIGSGIINICEVRALPGDGEYIVRSAFSYDPSHLIHQTLRGAMSSFLPFEVFINRYDPHLGNFADIENTQVTFDCDAAFNPNFNWVQFCITYLENMIAGPFQEEEGATRLYADFYDQKVINDTIDAVQELDIDGIVSKTITNRQTQRETTTLLKRRRRSLRQKVDFLIEYISQPKYKTMTYREFEGGRALEDLPMLQNARF